VSAGTVETARIRAPDAEKVRLTVRYPRHAHASWSVTAPSSTTFPVRWTVPRTAHPGVAHLVALFARSNVTLRTSFTIR
jgi:hypothetical protein